MSVLPTCLPRLSRSHSSHFRERANWDQLNASCAMDWNGRYMIRMYTGMFSGVNLQVAELHEMELSL